MRDISYIRPQWRWDRLSCGTPFNDEFERSIPSIDATRSNQPIFGRAGHLGQLSVLQWVARYHQRVARCHQLGFH